jgi:hypothetical protein
VQVSGDRQEARTEAAEETMKQVQVHIVTPASQGEVNKVEWVDENLKPKAGMVIPFKGDRRVWTVKHAYTNSVQEVK